MAPGLNLRDLYLAALTSQILGYYDDKTKEMTVVQRSGAFGPLERMTLAHEYTHALQDQHFGLDSLQTDDPSQSDRSLARLALAEGDASLLMTLWAKANLTPQELAVLVQQSSDPAAQAALDRLPQILRQQFTFPYRGRPLVRPAPSTSRAGGTPSTLRTGSSRTRLNRSSTLRSTPIRRGTFLRGRGAIDPGPAGAPGWSR